MRRLGGGGRPRRVRQVLIALPRSTFLGVKPNFGGGIATIASFRAGRFGLIDWSCSARHLSVWVPRHSRLCREIGVRRFLLSRPRRRATKTNITVRVESLHHRRRGRRPRTMAPYNFALVLVNISVEELPRLHQLLPGYFCR